MSEVAVYTCNLGDYDPLYEPIVCDPNVDYIYLTDRERRSHTWTVRVVEPPYNPILSARYYFCQSIKFFPEYDITIEHGADCQLKIAPLDLVGMIPDEFDIAVFKHPHRKSVYQEGDECIRLRKDTAERIRPQMERYREEGLPESVRLSTCILTVRRNTPQVQALEEMWWNEVLNNSHRNQLSFDYCRWRLGIEVFHLPGSPYDKSLIDVHRHPRRG